MRIRRLVLAGLLGAVLAIPGVLAQTGTLIVGELSEPVSLDPYLSNDMTSLRWADLVYSSLVRIDENLAIVPDLARDWSPGRDSQGRNTLTFTLRPDVFWHDGVPFRAADVVATWRAVTDPSTPTTQHSRFFGVENMIAVDDRTLQVTFSREFSADIGTMSFKILPEHRLRTGTYDQSHPLVRQPVGTGPFRFSQWIDGQFIILSANGRYHEPERPRLETIVIRFFQENQNTLLTALELGDINMVLDLPPEQIQRFRANRAINLYNYLAHAYDFVGFNLNRSPLDQREVREAIILATDRARMVEQIYQGHAQQVSGPFPLTSWAYNASIAPRPHDVARARSLLDRAGIVDTDGNGIREYRGRDIELRLLFIAGDDLVLRRVLAFRAYMEALGIRINAEPLPLRLFMQRVFDERDFDLFTSGWNIGVDPDPYSIWYSGEIAGGLNAIGYFNPDVDELILDARRTSDRRERELRYFQVHDLIHRDMPYMFLWTRERTLALARDFAGFTVNHFELTRELVNVYRR